ncbi:MULTISPECIES: 16S rRNA (adenine(1518)-N(6)/adenine(1519)-N(6))-dimethyltransferase RsmA [Psychrobacter]|jgi:16S rRNA (adenine1518-N6/adenine1519-N6)-dimethyltransferase|uniref:16S rRNA (adenine(1518)-N(6)/adenine(1519)-N(6))- dimethyltransferase RsmA n=2 Tax=Moraxellaceae TaxID=468 RepID=UPI000C4F8742|nr:MULTISPECIES: 16S rRNA (adenine(1518)-N(6)/adenine(1519)-N(6))-dimethyltransferase RsmA [Psychrobacter]MAE40092.1 16S rRNA (adenine(1518)-N(6)/adenine(1519)-N(6))-dimethyltransferase [Psychrobacter sp.]MCG3882808.1 16S rRNA (adenine(1518)-N(6)/adenine(1519)-N(6))-dimethyltransferase RsmA [Psychrobacter sp. Ps3]HAM60845.1 16S rRNA (adenine(1518)-N(6)/adenine(1519)-N(6))-dimethyltransferase [Psychrobacter sp.]|tara:strand:- start:386 stop:1255 length:870 start_codon:yes stop_codon:yes gene_type:complete
MSKPSFDAKTLSASLRSAKHQPRKRFGQNFLHDSSVIRQIVDSIRLERDDNLIEIGPGMGALTEPLLAEVNAMSVVELDRDLADSLRIRIGANSHPNFTIIKANAMDVDYRELYSEEKGKLRVVGNLPYNISTPILFHLLEFADVIEDMHFMLQKEVVERITADVGSKTYGRLSVIMQYHCETDYLLTVPRGAFNPPPKVTSAVFRLTPHTTKPVVAEDEDHFAIVVRETFNHRRKTLRAIFKQSALLPTLNEDDFAACAIDPQARPETLSVSDFVTLSNRSGTLMVTE